MIISVPPAPINIKFAPSKAHIARLSMQISELYLTKTVHPRQWVSKAMIYAKIIHIRYLSFERNAYNHLLTIYNNLTIYTFVEAHFMKKSSFIYMYIYYIHIYCDTSNIVLKYS